MMEWVIAIVYSAALLFIFLFSLGQLHLTWYFWKSKKTAAISPAKLTDYPLVTIQLPVFNEKYVVLRLLENVAKIDYPKDRLEIQLLDDSTDETVEIAQAKITELAAAGLNIVHVRRDDRQGFKAGALKYGMEIAMGEFLAVFDSDFLPKKDFLKKTLPYFQNEKTGMVQTRWGHINENYSLLTKLQAFGLDAHFTIEQSGRSQAGSFINFNGTAGVWRKTCIEDAGGWSADTLTEDLDLSYRAQLNGWEFEYLQDVVAPAELPVIMPAIKTQQYRWNKGAAETARKNLGNVWRSKIGFIHKVHATFHLFNSSVFLALLTAAILSVPILYLGKVNQQFDLLFSIGSVFLLGFLSVIIFYWTATWSIRNTGGGRHFAQNFPFFLAFSMGLSLHNALAVFEGLINHKTPFIRTPKFNILSKKDSWKSNQYLKPKLSLITVSEGILSLYFVFGLVSSLTMGNFQMAFFHAMLASGFGGIFFHSLAPLKNA